MEKWSVLNPLTIEERRAIYDGINQDLSSREIAENLGRSKSTILREVRRLGIDKYQPEIAQKQFEDIQRATWQKQRKPKKNAKKRNPHMQSLQEKM